MRRSRQLVLTAASILLAMGCQRSSAPRGESATDRAPAGPPADLYLARDSAAVIVAARALMEVDRNAALTSVDETGQPRVRTVNARLSDFDSSNARRAMTVWVLTRASTRKVGQIRRHPAVTLYFNDDARETYLSIMGTAIIHDDPADAQVQRFLDAGTRRFFWPDFPREFLVIEVRPRWIEFLSAALPGHQQRWTPQAVVFTE